MSGERGISELSALWQEVGQTQGAIKGLEDRSGRIEVSISELQADVNKRFDGVKVQLDKQDETLNEILRQTSKREGADDAAANSFMKRVNASIFWVSALGCVSILSGFIATIWIHGFWFFLPHAATITH